MVFNDRYLFPMHAFGSDAPQVWLYKTADTAADIDTAGYFANAARRGMKLGDIVWRVTVDNVAAPTSVSTYGTHLINSAALDATDTTAGTVTDTD